VTGLQQLARHRTVGLDSNVFVYLFETAGPQADAASAVVDAVSRHNVIFASIGVVEVLGGPARSGDQALMERYLDEIKSMDGLRIVPLDDEIGFSSALERARGRLTLGDAIHLATARAAGATAFVTNDDRLRSNPGLEIIPLSAFAG
jgi:predicted nucleic acid-binding protein